MGLVGAGSDGLQLQVHRSCVELEAAVAGLTYAAGLKQLLAWHRGLLVTTAGAEHITTVPIWGDKAVTTGLCFSSEI